jgi:hypothetical protein
MQHQNAPKCWKTAYVHLLKKQLPQHGMFLNEYELLKRINISLWANEKSYFKKRVSKTTDAHLRNKFPQHGMFLNPYELLKRIDIFLWAKEKP